MTEVHENASGKFGAPSSANMTRSRKEHSPVMFRAKESQIATMEAHHERSHHTINKSTTILNTVEVIQASAEEFSEHITMLNKQFKTEVLAKIKSLKVQDTQMLTERVSTSLS
jgi:hypothetical protein